ncbi:hypothetical protein BFN03_02320 [Rhodococcus sp. WMMA185]|nr:hypothetical protein BFN03_02320 [Rhodococcus sp. WMMA185]
MGYSIEQDAVAQLIAFIDTGLERGDLRDDEVDVALGLARQNRLLKDSQYFAEKLAKVKARRATGVSFAPMGAEVG